MSGHSKWAQIKRQKGATDAKRSKVFSRHAALITLASRAAGGNIAVPTLANVVERAKKDLMPKENIERAIAKGIGTGANDLTEVTFELFGPGGTAIIVTAITDNNNRTSQEIRHILTKAGLALGAPGSAAWAFAKADGVYTPTMPVDLSDEDAEKLSELVDALEAHDDVQEVFTSASEGE